MPGWVIVVIVVLAAAALFALAWWSSGRERPLGGRQGSRMSQAEQDYLSSGADRKQGQYGSFGGGSGT